MNVVTSTMASDKSTLLLQSLANTTMIDLNAESEPSGDAECSAETYYYYAVLWKIVLLLWDLSGIVVQVRF